MIRILFISYAIIIRIVFLSPVAIIVGFYRLLTIPVEMYEHWDYGELIEDVLDELSEGQHSHYRNQIKRYAAQRKENKND